MHFLSAIVNELELELDRRLGFTEAEITSARELNDGERRTLEGTGRKSHREKGACPLFA